VRYLFRGLIRENGRPVEGHVEAPNPDEALKALSDNGIVTESLNPDPKPLNLNAELPDAPEFANALESAFDSSSQQVAFDDLTERYKGKKVWVIDRDKIRRRVAQVVDQALQQSQQKDETGAQTRQRVQAALQGMFADNRNIAVERNADSLAGAPALGNGAAAAGRLPAPPMPAGYDVPLTSTSLEAQITKLSQVVAQAERVMASLALAARNIGRGGGGGGGGGRRISRFHDHTEEQNQVLLEIFKSNLELARSMQDRGQPGNNGAAAPAPQGS